YVPDGMHEEWERRDPIDRYEKRLREEHGFTEEEVASIREACEGGGAEGGEASGRRRSPRSGRHVSARSPRARSKPWPHRCPSPSSPSTVSTPIGSSYSATRRPPGRTGPSEIGRA